MVEIFRWGAGERPFYMGGEAAKGDFPLERSIGPIVEAGVGGMIDDAFATARYRPWIDRKLVTVEIPPGLREAGFEFKAGYTPSMPVMIDEWCLAQNFGG